MKPIKHMQGGAHKPKDWHWAYNVIIIGLFVGMFSIAFVVQKTFITKLELSKILAFSCFVWFVVPIKYYAQWLDLNKLAVFLLGIFGFGPLIVSALLWTNYLVIKEVHEIECNIIEIVPESYNLTGGGITSVLYELEYDVLWDYPEFRRFEFVGDKSLLKAKGIKYSFGKGVLGYDVIEERELLFE